MRFACAALIVVAALVASSGAPADSTPVLEPVFFKHGDHEGYGVKMKDNCAACHAVDKNGTVAVPGANGHQPCQTSGCHNTWFLSAGMPTDKNYVRAASFCLGCHDTPDGKAPKPSAKAVAVFRSFKAELEFHVEMPGPDDPDTHGVGSHLAHSDKKSTRQDCRSCHIVQKDGLLEPGTPGHGQCVVCHDPEDRKKGNVKVSMEMCDKCHRSGARQSPWETGLSGAGSRHGDDKLETVNQKTTATHATSVRSCNSEAFQHIAALSKHPEKLPCFKHERPEHRFRDYSASAPKDEVQCSQCHFMINDDSTWGAVSAKVGHKVQYFSLDDIHKNPIISNSMNEEHQACGSGKTGCHSKDIPDRGAGRCELCHAGQETSAF